jgi:hypothetical protein
MCRVNSREQELPKGQRTGQQWREQSGEGAHQKRRRKGKDKHLQLGKANDWLGATCFSEVRVDHEAKMAAMINLLKQ